MDVFICQLWQIVKIGKFRICCPPLGQDQARTNVGSTRIEEDKSDSISRVQLGLVRFHIEIEQVLRFW